MAATFTPPPTSADPVIVDEKTKRAQFNPIWLKWFIDITAFVSQNSGGSTSANHENLSGLLGGATSEHYHFTAAEHTALQTYVADDGDLFNGYTVGGTLKSKNAAAMVQSTVAFNNGAAAAVATLTNAPAIGNPTKWIPINDNGVTRYIPAW